MSQYDLTSLLLSFDALNLIQLSVNWGPSTSANSVIFKMVLSGVFWAVMTRAPVY